MNFINWKKTNKKNDTNKCKDMEDDHTQLLDINNDKNCAFFAVYDGHGGARVAEYAGKYLHERILNHSSYSKKAFKKF